MKRKTASRRLCRAFALVEIIISTAVTLIVGGVIFYVLNTGMVLFAKNTAVNMAHQQARVAVLTMEADLHAAASIPQLVDVNKVAVAGSGPAAGISFQVFAAGPFPIAAMAASGQSQISVTTGSYVPKLGQRLCLPLHQIELDITSIGSGSTRTLTLASPLPRPVETTLDFSGTPTSVIVTGFITDRYTYVVQGGELRYFKPGGPVAGVALVNDITAAAPFSIPVTPLGAPYNRFVAAINLSTSDHTSSRRGFKSANMFLNAMVPYRSKLCYYQ